MTDRFTPQRSALPRRLLLMLGITVGVVSFTIAGHLFAGTSSAHAPGPVLSLSDAQRLANAYAQRVVDDPRTPYVRWGVYRNCWRLYPHRIRCQMGFDTPETRSSRSYACVQQIQVYIRAHNTGDPRRYLAREAGRCG